MPPMKPSWWKDGPVYQIWPASYLDSTGSGTGDIRGILSTLPYLSSLGISTIWLSPMYDSPGHDMGYDVRDYEAVDPKFGTLADMDALISSVHAHGMRIILDLVINHTSDEHAWFVESRSSRTNPKADWYIWRSPKYIDNARHPPNNWRSFFGGSAWAYAPERDQYYLHLFASQQPDLNWENASTRHAIYDSAIRFWLDRGIDGFRVDTVGLYSKDTSFPDAAVTQPDEPFQQGAAHFVNGPRMHEWLREQRREVLDAYGDVVMVGEAGGTSREQLLAYVDPKHRMLDMTLDFDVVTVGGNMRVKPHETWRYKLTELKDAFMKTQMLLSTTDAWVSVFAENHDQGRSLSRFATDEPRWRVAAAKMLATLLGTLSGTLFLYQGQEIGMVNFPESWGKEELKDVAALNYLQEMRERYPGDEGMVKKAMAGLQKGGRDNARTPVQWSAAPNAGFTTGTPWMRVIGNYNEINVEDQLGDPESPLTFWKTMLRVRKEHLDVLVHGDFQVEDYENQMTFTYVKEGGGKTVLVALNFTDEEQPIFVPRRFEGRDLEVMIAASNSSVKAADELKPWEGRAYFVR